MRYASSVGVLPLAWQLWAASRLGPFWLEAAIRLLYKIDFVPIFKKPAFSKSVSLYLNSSTIATANTDAIQLYNPISRTPSLEA
jgi:hypothetical protein